MKNEPELTGSMHHEDEEVMGEEYPEYALLKDLLKIEPYVAWKRERSVAPFMTQIDYIVRGSALLAEFNLLSARYNALKDAAQELMKQSAPICNAECLTSWKNENEFDQAYLAVKALLNKSNITEMK